MPQVMTDIYKTGYSRVPVFGKDRNDVLGIILAKDLMFVDSQDEVPVRNFLMHFGRKPHVFRPEQKVGEVSIVTTYM
jgi:metal transporter CNNM